jgi:hypothetical protein
MVVKVRSRAIATSSFCFMRVVLDRSSGATMAR